MKWLSLGEAQVYIGTADHICGGSSSPYTSKSLAIPQTAICTVVLFKNDRKPSMSTWHVRLNRLRRSTKYGGDSLKGPPPYSVEDEAINSD